MGPIHPVHVREYPEMLWRSEDPITRVHAAIAPDQRRTVQTPYLALLMETSFEVIDIRSSHSRSGS